MEEPRNQPVQEPEESIDESRRSFLNTYGKAALVASPAITGLIATSMSSPAIAASSGGGGGGGGAIIGLVAGGAEMGIVAAAPKRQAAVLPVSQPAPVTAPAAPVQQLPPAPPPPLPTPERG